MTPRQRSRIYLRAAESIDSLDDIYCCISIGYILNLNRILMSERELSKLVEKYCPELFLFHPICPIGNQGWWGNPSISKNQSCRVLALLFCAAMTSE